MLARIRKAMDEKDQGFTLIELLVVMIIIGILAAIAIPTFLNQRNKGYDTQAKSDLRSAQTEMETYYTDAQAYPTTIVGGRRRRRRCAADTIYVKKSASVGDPHPEDAAGHRGLLRLRPPRSPETIWRVASTEAGVLQGAC